MLISIIIQSVLLLITLDKKPKPFIFLTILLMEITFRRDANDRQITFFDVSQQTSLSEDKVELLVMKALSKGLVKGHIDQVEQTINLSWVQPRVLDRDQLKTIMAKISTLNDSIKSMENMIENNAGEILTM